MIPIDKVEDVKFALPKFYVKNASNVVLDTIKRAEDSNDIIIRLYESQGGHAPRARLMRYVCIPFSCVYMIMIIDTLFL